MDLDPTWLFLSLIPSGIGFVLFVYGKKQGRLPQIVGGLVLMVYPYFVQSTAALLGTGIAVCAILYYVIQAGW